MSTTATTAAAHGIADLTAHEEREHARIEQAKAAARAAEAALHEQQQKECAETEQRERATASKELQSFESQELPGLLRSADDAIANELAAIDASAKSRHTTTVNFCIERITSGALAI